MILFVCQRFGKVPCYTCMYINFSFIPTFRDILRHLLFLYICLLHLSFFISIHLSIHPSIHSHIHPFMYPPIHPPIHSSIIYLSYLLHGYVWLCLCHSMWRLGLSCCLMGSRIKFRLSGFDLTPLLSKSCSHSQPLSLKVTSHIVQVSLRALFSPPRDIESHLRARKMDLKNSIQRTWKQ